METKGLVPIGIVESVLDIIDVLNSGVCPSTGVPL